MVRAGMVMIWVKVKESTSLQEKMWDVHLNKFIIYDFDYALTTATSTWPQAFGVCQAVVYSTLLCKSLVSNNHHKTNVALKFDLNFDPTKN